MLFWLVLFLVLLAVEICTVTLTTVWFALGALAAVIVSLLGGELWLQVTVFLVVALLLLFFTRPIAMKFFNKGLVKTNVEEIIGKHVVVTKEVDNRKGQGEVMVKGLPWTARSVRDDLVLTENQIVEIKAVEGVKVIVEPVDTAQDKEKSN